MVMGYKEDKASRLDGIDVLFTKAWNFIEDASWMKRSMLGVVCFLHAI